MIELLFGAALMIAQMDAPEANVAESVPDTEEMDDAKSDAIKEGLGHMAPSAQDDGKLICRRDQELGSRLRAKRVCKTQAEWNNDREAAAAVLREKRGGAGGPQLGNEG